jgi:hypothetical protein
MLAAAKALGVKPTVFTEYRLLNARRSFNPEYVGWQAAVKALNRCKAAG